MENYYYLFSLTKRVGELVQEIQEHSNLVTHSHGEPTPSVSQQELRGTSKEGLSALGRKGPRQKHSGQQPPSSCRHVFAVSKEAQQDIQIPSRWLHGGHGQHTPCWITEWGRRRRAQRVASRKKEKQSKEVRQPQVPAQKVVKSGGLQDLLGQVRSTQNGVTFINLISK